MPNPFEKAFDALQLTPLAFQYCQERKRAGLDKPSPFEDVSFLTGVLTLAKKIGPEITNYHLISDDRSARILTLTLLAWQQRVAEAKAITLPQKRADFFLASHRFSRNQSFIKRFVKENQEQFRQKPNLLVTEFIDYGQSIERVLTVFDELKVPLDLAILSHFEPLAQYRDLFANRNVFVADDLPSKLLHSGSGTALLGRDDVSGLDTWRTIHSTEFGQPSKEIIAHHPVLKEEKYRNRPLELLARRQARDFAKQLPIPK